MKFLGNYCTLCSIQNNPIRRDVCFMNVLDFKNVQDYNVVIIKDPSYGFNTSNNHNCFVSRKQIKELLNSLCSIYKFMYDISETKYKEYPAYKIHLKFNAEDRRVDKLFILTCVRYTYEYPYNVILSEAFKISKFPEFRFINIISLCNLIQSTIFSKWQGRTIHGLLENNSTHLLTNKQIYERLKKRLRVFSVFERLRVPYIIDPKNKNTLEYWTDINEFIKRIKLYKNNLKDFKKK